MTIMIEHTTLHTLEYYKIREMLAEKAQSDVGKELIEKLNPSIDPEEVFQWMEETDEAYQVMLGATHIPSGGVRDIRAAVKRAELGGSLEPHELLAIANTLYAGRRLKQFLQEWRETAPILHQIGEGIVVLRSLETTIDNTVDDHGLVRDSASSELTRLRREIKVFQGRIKEKLDHTLRSSEYQKYFQDALVTMRGDRYVIPVKQEYRHQFPGIVHDQSASGATVFIEPMAVVQLNNDLKQAVAAEHNEVERILLWVSGQIAGVSTEILYSCNVLGRLDVIFAKAYLAREMKGTRPKLRTDFGVVLHKARHPLISKDTVVPIDMRMGETFSTLVITGPNTGGKTVSLKTTGLFALMAQSGLFIPAELGSEMPVFRNIFADIGDEQSIEQSLSTFSGHMTHVVRILGQAKKGDLVLIDEIGAGTDPDEGATLAMAILEEFHARGVLTIATTHYSELKTFAYTRSGVENASVEFDVVSLKPTYKLLIGTPGSSNAFAISHRLGLNGDIIKRAEQLMDKEKANFATVLAELEEEKRLYQQYRDEVERTKREIEMIRLAVEKDKTQFFEKKHEALKKAQEEAKGLIRRTKREAEAIIDQLKEQFHEQDHKVRQRNLDTLRKCLRDISEDVDISDELAVYVPAAAEGSVEFQSGDQVLVTSVGQVGTVLSVQGGEVTVQLGMMKMNVQQDKCRLAGKGAPAEKKKPATTFQIGKVQNISREIDIRGTNVEEAELVLGKYLDDAVLSGLNEVIVIHGKGTGALRKGVRDFLEKSRHVKKIGIAEYNMGGNGATVVTLK